MLFIKHQMREHFISSIRYNLSFYLSFSLYKDYVYIINTLQVLNGMDAKEREEFFFQPAEKYKFLSNGNLPVAGINDAQEYEDTREAMDIMGMPEEEKAG